MNYFKKFIFLFIFLIGANASNASTSKFIGVIGAAIGNIKNQNNEKLINGSKIFHGDTIISETKSNAQILFLDQTVLTLGEDSELTIDEFIYDPSSHEGSFVSNVMAADVDYQVICSGNTVKLVALSDEGNNTSASNALTNCSFCNLGEDEDFYTSFATSETFAGKSQVLKKVYLSFISNKTASNFYSHAPPLFS